MADATMKARVVRIHLEPKDDVGLYYATSPDLKGFMVSETSAEARDRAIPRAISNLYAACGVNVLVTVLDETAERDDVKSYVAVREEIARQALEHFAH